MQKPKQYFYLALHLMVPMFTCHCLIPWRSHVMAFYYTLCFNIHQPILYIFLHASFYFITAVIFEPAWFYPLITLQFYSLFHLHRCFLQMVHIINVYLLCPMISAPFLPNISIRWSWTESQLGVWRKKKILMHLYNL